MDHLEKTSALCEVFSGAFAPRAGRLVGLWHDLGKFRPEFQRYLLDNCEEGHRERSGKCEHSIVGAYRAYLKDRIDLAMIIAGHHGGLKNRSDFLNEIERGAKYQFQPPAEILEKAPVEFPPKGCEALWTRFLFSALVDADSLETERWDKGHARWRCERTPAELAELLDRHIATLNETASPSEMNELRQKVQAACRERANDSMGPFRLTVPTGGGKTLASLLFALHHAKQHGLKRVIVVIPYTSIIDQTVQVYREILGNEAVLEHHSNIDPETDNLVNRHCVENWDSPVVVTTSVQFFETLHRNRKRDLRKLHNVAESVVVLDEVQTFPLRLIKPIKIALNALTAHFHVSTLHCSATQPLLAQPDASEIAPDPSALFAVTRGRVEVHWPDDLKEPMSWEDLARRIRGHEHGRVLAIVHLKQDAIDLAKAVGEDCTHLSTLMCPAHRRTILETISADLKTGRCLVVATQLVEAGVDLDFPVVYRALAGVDSLAQAAGRCNREGRLPQSGEFHVFLAPSDPPGGVLRKGMQTVRGYLNAGALDVLSPAVPARYFTDLGKVIDFGSPIPAEERSWNFSLVAELFEMIEDEGTPVIAPYGSDWLKRVKAVRIAPGIQNFRKLQPYTVSLRKKAFEALRARGCLVPLLDGSEGCWTVLEGHETVYSPRFGFGGGHGSLALLDV